jgi:hypothetical protein
MAVAAFSVFSAVSELFVTAAVFYVLGRAYFRDEFRGAFLAIVLLFETFVNIAYMSYRIIAPSTHATGTMAWLQAGHGTLSLLMFAGLIAFAMEANRLKKEGRNLLRERPRSAVAFVVLWSLSVASGEAIFLLSLAR